MLNDGGDIYYIFTFCLSEKAIAVWNTGILYTAKRNLPLGIEVKRGDISLIRVYCQHSKTYMSRYLKT